jgi:hypothetical protein
MSSEKPEVRELLAHFSVRLDLMSSLNAEDINGSFAAVSVLPCPPSLPLSVLLVRSATESYSLAD